MRRVANTVHVPIWEEDSDGRKFIARHEIVQRGEELPEWAVPFVGDHVFEPGEAPEHNAPVASPEPEPSTPKAAPRTATKAAPKRRGRPPAKKSE